LARSGPLRPGGAFASAAPKRWPCVCGKHVALRWKRHKLPLPQRTGSSKQCPARSLDDNSNKGPDRGRDGSCAQWVSLQHAALLYHSIARRGSPADAIAITKIVGKSGEKLASSNLWLIDDLLSIRSQTLRGNSEFFAKIHPVLYGASTARAHSPSLLAIMVPPLWETPCVRAGKTVLLPQE
jgi:hypothetical protein